MSEKEVCFSSCNSYSRDAVRNAVFDVFESCGGTDSFIHKGSRVLIKPNMLAAAPAEDAVTTHPEVVGAVIEVVQEAGGIAFVGDSPMEGSLEYVAEKCGILKVAQERGASLLSLQKNTRINLNNAHTCSFFNVSEEALGMDCIVNVPKLKNHTLTGITGAVKNCYGLIGGNHKKFYHVRYPLINDFANVLLDLYLATLPVFSVIDAVVAMEGLGPRSGKPKPVKAIFASRDAIAVDAVAARFLGYNIQDISFLKAAVERGLLRKDLSDIRVIGDINEIKKPLFDKGASGGGFSFIWNYAPAWVRGLRERWRPWPHITSSCTSCGKCVRHCPVEAIALNKGADDIANIIYNKCIRCYCCQEVCSYGAINLKKSVI